MAIYGATAGFAVGTGAFGLFASLLSNSFILFIFSAVAFWGAVYALLEFLADVKKVGKALYK
jgi:hypothetical protein